MRKVQRSELLDYQTYTDQRDAIRDRAMANKAPRRIHVGENLTFLFENATTVHYQVQEMMRVERLVREADIQHELDTYNELIGDEGELGCVLLVEIAAPDERDRKLVEWLGLVDALYAELADGTRVRATYDPRQVGRGRLSSVQYLKFDTAGQVPVALGADLPELTVRTELTAVQLAALQDDVTAAG